MLYKYIKNSTPNNIRKAAIIHLNGSVSPGTPPVSVNLNLTTSGDKK